MEFLAEYSIAPGVVEKVFFDHETGRTVIKKEFHQNDDLLAHNRLMQNEFDPYVNRHKQIRPLCEIDPVTIAEWKKQGFDMMKMLKEGDLTDLKRRLNDNDYKFLKTTPQRV